MIILSQEGDGQIIDQGVYTKGSLQCFSSHDYDLFTQFWDVSSL